MPHTPTHIPSPFTPTTTPPPLQPQPQPQLVPLAVWPTPHTSSARLGDPGPAGPAGPGWRVPPLLAQHLIAVYTAPGGTVLAVGNSARTLARTALRLERRPPARGHDRRAAARSVDLLVLTPPALDPGTGATGGGGWRRWPQLLAPAGILAVVLHPTRAPGDPAAVIAAAAGAGLTYLQHAIAVLWPLHADHLDPPRHPGCDDPGRGELPAAHADVLMFIPGPSPESEDDPETETGTGTGTDTDGRAAGRQPLDLDLDLDVAHEGDIR